MQSQWRPDKHKVKLGFIEHSLGVNEVARDPVLSRESARITSVNGCDCAQVTLADGRDHPLSGSAGRRDNRHAYVVQECSPAKPFSLRLRLSQADSLCRLRSAESTLSGSFFPEPDRDRPAPTGNSGSHPTIRPEP